MNRTETVTGTVKTHLHLHHVLQQVTHARGGPRLAPRPPRKLPLHQLAAAVQLLLLLLPAGARAAAAAATLDANVCQQRLLQICHYQREEGT